MKPFATLAVLFAALSSAAELEGEYDLNMPEVASGLVLRKDGTFEYAFIYGAADYRSSGTWRSESGAVVLNSAGKEEPAFAIVSQRKVAAKGTRVRVQAPNGQGVAHIEVTLESGGKPVTAATDQSGWAVLPASVRVKHVSLHVPVYDIGAGPYEIDAQLNEVIFQINGEAITTVRFQNERLKIAGDATLEMTYWDRNKPMRYVKQQ
jgi:hypothetical protein